MPLRRPPFLHLFFALLLLTLLHANSLVAASHSNPEHSHAADPYESPQSASPFWEKQEAWHQNNVESVYAENAPVQYEPGFAHFDRSIIGRADTSNIVLSNNNPVTDTVAGGSYNFYTFSLAESSKRKRRNLASLDETNHTNHDQELDKRDTQDTIYISVTTCLQPQFQTGYFPQLALLYSISSANQQPEKDDGFPLAVFTNGFYQVAVNGSDEVYIGIYGQSTDVASGTWTYDIAASSDEFYHKSDPFSGGLALLDSDSSAGLLITTSIPSTVSPQINASGFTDQGAYMTLFIQQNPTPSLFTSINNSYCGLLNYANFTSTFNNSSITTNIVSYANNLPQQQWYVPNLTSSTSYLALAAQPPSPGTPGGGGIIFAATNFTTKTYPNCQLLYNLSFCSEVAWAVPANPDMDFGNLSATYDNFTQITYQGFNYSLQQIPCNTTATAQYSLNKTCDDCATAYKSWLCAVSIPRCADWAENYSLTVPHLMPRNAAQTPLAITNLNNVTNTTLLNYVGTSQSRNLLIDQTIMPGPYREVLPCADMCYELVRSCPAALGFGCPLRGKGLEVSYGFQTYEGQPWTIEGLPACNIPGSVFRPSSAGAVTAWAPLLVLGWVLLVVATASGV